MDIHSYRFVDWSTYYSEQVAKECQQMASRLLFQMNSQLSYPMDSMSIFGFLDLFKMAYDKNRVHEGAGFWLVRFFTEITAPTSHAAPLSLMARSLHSIKDVMLTSFVQPVNHLLETYERDNIIAGPDKEIVHFIQPTNMSGTITIFLMKNLRCVMSMYERERWWKAYCPR